MLKLIYKFLFSYNYEKYEICKKWNIIVTKFVQLYMPYYYKVSKKDYGLNKSKKRKEKIIISLTTIPSRMKTLPLCIESLLRQTLKPDKIILWISKEEFKDFKLEHKLLSQKKRGLEICYCDDDLKSHKKYYYTMQKYPNDIVITVDDDVYYPENLVEELIKGYEENKKNKNCVICSISNEILLKNNNQIEKYINWKQISSKTVNPSFLLLAIGINGILYPPGCLSPMSFDKEKIKSLSLYASDLWLKIMELLNNTKVKNVYKYNKMWVTIQNTQQKALWKYNVIKHKNDQQLKALLNEYNIDLKLYADLDRNK